MNFLLIVKGAGKGAKLKGPEKGPGKGVTNLKYFFPSPSPSHVVGRSSL